jgi:hypothetical protein
LGGIFDISEEKLTVPRSVPRNSVMSWASSPKVPPSWPADEPWVAQWRTEQEDIYAGVVDPDPKSPDPLYKVGACKSCGAEDCYATAESFYKAESLRVYVQPRDLSTELRRLAHRSDSFLEAGKQLVYDFGL